MFRAGTSFRIRRYYGSYSMRSISSAFNSSSGIPITKVSPLPIRNFVKSADRSVAVAVTSLVYIPLYLAAYSVSWGYAIAALTYSNTHSGARKSPPFYLSPIIVNTLCSILPIVFIIIITPLTLFADRDFTNGVDGIKEFVAVLTNASVNFNAGRPVDISSLPALQVQLMATFQKSKDWVRMSLSFFPTLH